MPDLIWTVREKRTLNPSVKRNINKMIEIIMWYNNKNMKKFVFFYSKKIKKLNYMSNALQIILSD